MSRGYPGAPELTAERFIPDSLSGTSGARLYKSGDLACWRADGTLHYLGRVDRQIEIRGLRFDPAEVESVLCRHATVRQAVVVSRVNRQAGRTLVAYAVPSGNLLPDLPELQASLGKYRPS